MRHGLHKCLVQAGNGNEGLGGELPEAEGLVQCKTTVAHDGNTTGQTGGEAEGCQQCQTLADIVGDMFTNRDTVSHWELASGEVCDGRCPSARVAVGATIKADDVAELCQYWCGEQLLVQAWQLEGWGGHTLTRLSSVSPGRG